MIKRQKIIITGRVQGVGFRPAVYQIATQLGLGGFVYNDTRGVTIELQGAEERLAEFPVRLQGDDRPALARIKSCDITEIPVVEGQEGFFIRASDSAGAALSQVTADTASCADCLAEMAESGDFRYRYPFINCTNCGPRYSIVKTIPYDRPNTTMSVFPMCGNCGRQYKDVADRRFHAQPVACGECGPRIWLADSSGCEIESDSDKVIAKAADLLRGGKIVAIKGVGGFHLACDALNERAVRRLRERKRRDHKPFAMMVDSVERIKKYAEVSQIAEKVLRSAEAPIVLLQKKKGSLIAPSAAEGVSSFGFMLCYAPLHFLLFGEGLEVLVMTSGNVSDEPLICKNQKALEKLGSIADVFLMHDREIFRQVDDSIVHFIDGQPVLLRRARGYVPTPIFIRRASCVMRDALGEEKQNTQHEISLPQDILATGADMKNTFCLVKGEQLICSEHIGDLEDADVYHHYVDSIRHLGGLYEFEPKIVACDLHPGYLSTQFAKSLKDVQVLSVQHHWAHICSVLAEHNVTGPVIGLVCDGTGYGTDGAVWGCECMIADLNDFSRFGHLDYYYLAGADKASKEAIRPVLGLLKKAYGDKFSLEEFEWLLKRIEPDINKQQIILQQIEKQINAVETSSLGRVFDAVAAMVGLGGYNHFEAQLPMALEAIVEPGVEECYDFEFIENSGEPLRLDLRRMTEQMVGDIKREVAGSVISAKFHNCLAAALLGFAKKAQDKSGLDTVALSGGVFCNRYLTNRLIMLLKKAGFDVLFNRDVPSNDGGISLGQAAIVARCSSLVTRS